MAKPEYAEPAFTESPGRGIYRRWIQASDIGVHDDFSIENRKRLRLANQVTLFTAILTVVYFFIFAGVKLYLPALIMLIAFFVYCLVIRLQYVGRQRIALTILLIIGNLQIASVSFMLGADAGIHLFFVAAAMSPFLYFSIADIKLIVGFALFSLALYLGLELSFQTMAPWIKLSDSVALFCYFSTYVSNLIAVIFFTYYLYDANFRAESALLEERLRSDRLLLNIMPESVANRLKSGEKPIADFHEGVSIMFVDIVAFTPLSIELSATETVELLDTLFTRFDNIVEAHGVEKMRTTGDGYYVASGVPEARDDHAPALIKVAMEMLQFVKSNKFSDQHELNIRIGIDTGSVVAGVIGEKKLQYDLWGDAVNTASRMESHGEAGRIHISPAIRELVKDIYNCAPRGEIEVKGKGIMETWFIDPE